MEEALHQLDKNIKDEEEAHIRLNLLVKDYLALDAKEQASEVLHNKKAKLCTFKISRSEEHTSALQSHSETSYSVLCLNKQNQYAIQSDI